MDQGAGLGAKVSPDSSSDKGKVIRHPSPRVALLLKEKVWLFTIEKFQAAKVIHIGCGELDEELPHR